MRYETVGRVIHGKWCPAYYTSQRLPGSFHVSVVVDYSTERYHVLKAGNLGSRRVHMGAFDSKDAAIACALMLTKREDEP